MITGLQLISAAYLVCGWLNQVETHGFWVFMAWCVLIVGGANKITVETEPGN